MIVRVFLFFAVALLTSCSLINLSDLIINQNHPMQSKESLELKKFYKRTHKRLRARGLLRTDNGTLDHPYTAKTLTENFLKIALYDEYKIEDGVYVAKERKSKLKRWETPITINVIHGETSTDKQIKTDIKNIKKFAKRLSEITNQSIGIENKSGNIIILFLDINEQKQFGTRLASLVPLLEPSMINAIVSSPRSTFCSAYALSRPPNDYEYISAIILIKSEHQALMRKSCIHEEMAQAMGLSNDSKFARPSIFNDDEEFALLTKHDENLLKILYDSRLKPGMDMENAKEIVAKIAEELVNPKKYKNIERD